MTPAAVLSILAGGTAALVLLISGVAKLGDTSRTQHAMVLLGVPEPLRDRWLAAALPYIEIALGIFLLFAPDGWHRAAGAVAVVLFVIFSMILRRALRTRDDLNCACFGALSSGRVSRRTLLRNAIFILISLVYAAGPSSLVASVSPSNPFLAGTLASAGAVATAVVVRLMSVQLRQRRVQGLTLAWPDGEAHNAGTVLTGADVAIFLASSCPTCLRRSRDLYRYRREFPHTSFVYILVGIPGEFSSNARQYGPVLRTGFYDTTGALADTLQVRRFPAVVDLRRGLFTHSPISGYGKGYTYLVENL